MDRNSIGWGKRKTNKQTARPPKAKPHIGSKFPPQLDYAMKFAHRKKTQGARDARKKKKTVQNPPPTSPSSFLPISSCCFITSTSNHSIQTNSATTSVRQRSSYRVVPLKNDSKRLPSPGFYAVCQLSKTAPVRPPHGPQRLLHLAPCPPHHHHPRLPLGRPDC